MKNTRLRQTTLLFLFLCSPALAAVKQVRVISDRAGIYIEPSRSSSRIEVVEKGTVLNLFQQKKVKDVWYYVSFTSRRYGSRISGFIHESSVELVEDAAAVAPKAAEKKTPEKTEPGPAPAKPAAQTIPEKPQPVLPKAEPKQEVQPKPEPAARYAESLVATAAPKARSFKLPRSRPAGPELAWKPPPALQPKVEPEVGAVEIRQPPEKATETAPPQPAPPPPQVKKTEAQPEPKKEVPVETKAEPAPEKETVPPAAAPSPATQAPPVKPPRLASPGRKPGFFTLGMGYGSSFGGAGACLQLNAGSRFALHAGAGLYPTTLIYSETEWVENKALFSVGIKYYLPFSSASLYPYIDVQYGGLRVEAAQLVIGIWEYSYVYSQEQKTLYGPTVLAGAEIRLGRFGINGALGFSYSLTEWEYLEKKAALAFDAGLIVYF